MSQWGWFALKPPQWLTAIENSSSRRSSILSWCLLAPDMHVVFRHTSRKRNHIHKVNKPFKKRAIYFFHFYCCNYNIITSFLLFLTSLKTPLLPPPFKFMVSSLIVITCMHAHIFIYIFIPKYNLLSVYDVTYMYDFRTSCMVSSSHLVCFALGETISPVVTIS